MSTVIENDLSSQVNSALNPPGILSPEGGLIIYRAFQQEFCFTPGRPVMQAYNPELRQVVFFRPLCKSWKCPYCARRRATAAQIRAVRGVEVLSGTKHVDFVTVTSHERLDPAATLAVLPLAWNKLNRRLKRAAGDAQYFAVPEQHEDGRWHLHAIIAADLSLKKKWWKDNARSCGLGYQSDVKEVTSAGGVGGYVSKYLTKSLEYSNLPKYFKHVRSSHGWPKQPVPEKPAGWTFSMIAKKTPLRDEMRRAIDAGLTVVDADGLSSWSWINDWAAMDFED